MVKLALLLMKHIDSPSLSNALMEWMDMLRQIEASPNGIQALMTALRYATSANEGLGQDDLQKLAHQVGSGDNKVHEALMTLAEQWKQEGQQEGLRKGLRETLRKQIMLKFGRDALSAEYTELLIQASPAQLETMAERILTVTAIETLFSRS